MIDRSDIYQGVKVQPQIARHRNLWPTGQLGDQRDKGKVLDQTSHLAGQEIKVFQPQLRQPATAGEDRSSRYQTLRHPLGGQQGPTGNAKDGGPTNQNGARAARACAVVHIPYAEDGY